MSKATQVKITIRQAEELRNRIDVRMEAVESDPESASEFESKDGALESLRKKLNPGFVEFSEVEIEWCKDEAYNLFEIASSNARGGEMDMLATASSMKGMLYKFGGSI